MDYVDQAFTVMTQNLENNFEVDLAAAKRCEDQIDRYRNLLKREHIKNVETGVYPYESGVFYSDLYSQCERMGDYIINVSEDIKEMDTVEKAMPKDELPESEDGGIEDQE